MIGLLVTMVAGAVVAPDSRCAARVAFVQPAHGVISTPNMAAKIAETYLNAVYGADVIADEMPLKVSIAREVWTVEGTHRRTFLHPDFIG